MWRIANPRLWNSDCKSELAYVTFIPSGFIFLPTAPIRISESAHSDLQSECTEHRIYNPRANNPQPIAQKNPILATAIV